MRPGSLDRCRVLATWRRLRRDEEGIALILAILIMLVLAIVLGAVILMTASAARDAHRSNAGQKASALAESGLNNALAVLNANYPGTTIYPGNPDLLLTTTLTAPVTLPAATITVASTTGYNAGSNTISVGSSGAVTCTGISATTFTGCTGGVAGTYATGTTIARATASGSSSSTWSGTLVNVPSNPSWKWQWQLTASGRVKNPTRPASDVLRTATAIVPVIIPDSASVDPGTTAVDFIYALHDITFQQSVNVAAPVYTGHDLILQNTATICEKIPASLTLPARPNRIAVGNDLTLTQPNNQVGQVGKANTQCPTPAADLGEAHVVGKCTYKNQASHQPCAWGATDNVWATVHDTVIPPGFITVPTLTCCSPVNWTVPADGTSHPGNPSYMGFWYLNAGLGPNAACATSTGTPPIFDTGDDTINQSAYAQGTPFDLTGATYSCSSANGRNVLAYDATSGTLTVKGTIFIDGSVRSTSTSAKYVGKGTLILSGIYTMDNNTQLCVNDDCGVGNPPQPWDADTTALAIVADGIDNSTTPPQSIAIKKGHFQGLLLGNLDVNGSVSGTIVVGPMVSVYGNVNAGQSGTLQFPPISFASSGTSGLTGPLPLPQLLSPINFGGG